MNNHILGVYNQLPISFEYGEGAWLFDAAGNKYLDAYAGIAVTGLGHNYPPVTEFIQDQAAKIIHTSNVVEVPQQMELSNLLAELAGVESRVFFNNSGAEAVETLLKLARIYGHSKNIAVPKTIVFDGSFHGRTIATIFAGASAKAQAGFEPAPQGFVRVKYNDAAAVEAAIQADPDVVAVLVEPVQGESGVKVPDKDYLSQLRAICDKHQVLLLIDEIQAGMGRTGKFFCHQHNGIVADGISLAKGLANGLPIGACIIRAPYCDLFKVGSHGSTFGGNPLCCGAALVTLKSILENKIMDNASAQGDKILTAFKQSLLGKKGVVEVRGKGLMIGVQLDRECRDILPIALKHNIIFNIANLNTIRLLPPLIINDMQTQMIIDLIPELISQYYATA